MEDNLIEEEVSRCYGMVHFIQQQRRMSHDSIANDDLVKVIIEHHYQELSARVLVQFSIDEFREKVIGHFSNFQPTEYAAVDDKLEQWLEQCHLEPDFKSDFFVHYVNTLKGEGKTAIIPQLEEDTFTILDSCHDPRETNYFDRRGLVYGHVQSGKTANYIGLINRAYDAGYRIVIILAGLNEDLRAQTQQRIDDTINFNHASKRIRRGTTQEFDVISDQLPLIRENITESDRSIWVIKKNKIILENIIQWFLHQNERNGWDLFPHPVLIIDDEADNASIQSLSSNEFARWEEAMKLLEIPEESLTLEQQELLDTASEEIRTINKLIRGLLSILGKKTFIAYTATPYSVVNQASTDVYRELKIGQRTIELTATDLFPEHFIIPLTAGSNYLGLDRTFNTDHKCNIPAVINLNTAYPDEDYTLIFPSSQDSEYGSFSICGSLTDSIVDFFIAIIVKKYRRIKGHNTLLIHTTYKTNNVKQLTKNIHNAIKEYQSRIKDDHSILKKINARLNELRLRSNNECYSKYFKLENNYPDVITKEELLSIFTDRDQKLSIIEYHSKSKDKIQYNLRDKEGNRVYKNYIIVGGNKLARGLTLEGLSISYFIRKTTRRDSLYQMGRWFGYRAGYEDLVSIYTTNEHITNYRSLFVLEKHLRNDFETNCSLENPILPRNAIIKLAVNSDEISEIKSKLIHVCDPNKLRHTKSVRIDSTGHTRNSRFNVLESADYQKNWDFSIKLFTKLNNEFEDYKFDYLDIIKEHPNVLRNFSFINIPCEIIIDYLSKLKFSGSTRDDFNFLIEFIKANEFVLSKWSVSLVNRHNNPSFNPPVRIGDTEIKKSRLQPKLKDETLRFVAILAREAGDTSFDLVGESSSTLLTEREVRDYRNANGKPLLLVYPNECSYADADVIRIPLIDVFVPNSQGLTKMEYCIRK